MPIKKRSINSQNGYTDYKHLLNNYNDSSFNNPSHIENTPTNFNLKEITLEDCDRSIYEEFNKRFRIANKWMPLIILDAELVSIHYQNYEQFDTDKQYLNGPYFTMFRKKAIPKYRTNPAFKPVVYTIPKMKANGIVFEEYLTEGPLSYDLIYELKFISNYREYTNEMEAQMRHYFRNRRNIIIVNTERFSIGPTDYNTLAEVEIVNRDSVEQKTMYISTYELKLDCWTRSLANMQKRERPNTIVLDIKVKDSLGERNDASTVIERYQKNTVKYPKHPSPNDTTDPHVLRRRKDNWLSEDGFDIVDQTGNDISNQTQTSFDIPTIPGGSIIEDDSGNNIQNQDGGDFITQG